MSGGRAAGRMARQRAPTAAEEAADNASCAATADEVSEFLRAEAARDPDIIDRFKAARWRAQADYRPRVVELFDKAIEDSQVPGGFDAESYGHMRLDLSPVLDEARELEERGNPIEAERMYRQLAEVIHDHMPSFDEWEGEFKGIFVECGRAAARCAGAAAAAARSARLASEYTRDAAACAEYLEFLRDGGDALKAQRIAADGARRFPDSRAVQSLALSLCPAQSAEYRAALRRMLVLTGSLGRLDELRGISPLWEADRRELIGGLAGRKRLLAEVLWREGMADELAGVVLSARWPGALPRRYHDALATPRHGGRLFAAYKRGAERAIEGARGGGYRELGALLRRMRRIPGQERRFDRYVAGLRRRFGRRRGLVAQLGRIGSAAGPPS